MLACRVSVLLAAVSASALLLTGCSGDESAPEAPAPSSGAGSASGHAGHDESSAGSDGAAVSDKQLLGKRDLPAGAKLKDVELTEYVTQNVGLLERIITEPAECAGLMKQVYQASGSDKQGLATAADVGEGQVVQTVGKADRNGISALRRLTEKCPTVQSTVDEQKSSATYRKLDTSKLDAEQSFGMVVMNRINGAPQAVRSVQILAIKDGLGVSLTISGDTGTDEVALANKALAKIH